MAATAPGDFGFTSAAGASFDVAVDFTTALAAAVGTLAALLARRDTGRGHRTGPHAVGAAT